MTTQNCPECGTHAEPGQSFCDACGAVLGWDQGARAARPAGSASHPRGPEVEAPRTPHETARATGGPDTGAPAHVGTAAATADGARAARAVRADGRGTGPAVGGGSPGPASGPQGPQGSVTGRSAEGTGPRAAAGGSGTEDFTDFFP
ncbi:zinc ribbon domain-containing protein, partial [Streptomyces sp. NPDC059456]|uniref:zinc ribbon domain-containing protein n=1 Tax=Streptomyces sp. NPDC059456 TaxID=3346838 RepID=UPI0036A0B33C